MNFCRRVLNRRFMPLLGLFMSFCLAASPSWSLSNAELRIGINQEFETLNPVIANMMATTYLYTMVGRTLNTIDQSGKWIPQLAKSIPSLENKQAKFIDNKKKIAATFEILENAKWGDGVPLTCADIAFTREVGLSPNVPVGERDVYASIEKIEWDPKTPKKCVFTYTKARWDFYQQPTFKLLPKHIEEPVFKQYGGQKEGYEKNTTYVKNPTNPGLYNGPYLVSEVKLGSHISFVPNPYFYGKKPKIQKIVVKLIPNSGTLEANLKSGTIDLISTMGMTFDQAVAFEKKVKNEKMPYEVVFEPSLTYEHLDLDLTNPLLQDQKVRKALVYGLNRQELVQALFAGKQPVAIHNMAPNDPWFSKDPKDVVLYPYNPEKAKQLLDEAGWKINSNDGFRYRDGQKFSLLMMTTAGNRGREVVQTFLQAQWKKLGVEVNIKNEPAKVFFGETINKRSYKGMAMYAWTSAPESIPRSTLHSASIPTEKNSWSGQNTPAWKNQKVDHIIEQLEVEFNPKKRKDLAHQLLKEYSDDVPVIPLYYRSDIAVLPKGIKGYKLTGTQFPETNDVESWEIVNP